MDSETFRIARDDRCVFSAGRIAVAFALPVRLACGLTRTFRAFPGRWRVVRFIERNLAALGRSGPLRLRVGGRTLQASPLNNRYILINGLRSDEPVPLLLRKLLQPGDCVLDVGANLGYYAVVIGDLVGPSGVVHCFEPSPQVFGDLCENLSNNGMRHVTPHHVAVADKPGVLELHIPSAARSALCSLRDLGDDSGETVRVSAVTLDSLMSALSTVRLLKIDVEGAEQKVLTGAGKLIDRDRPLIVLELTDAWLRQLDGSAAMLCDFLLCRSYSLWRFDRDGVRPLESPPPTKQADVLAIPAEQLDDIRARLPLAAP